MNLEIMCIVVIESEEEKVYFARLKRGAAMTDVLITEEVANTLSMLFCVPFCRE